LGVMIAMTRARHVLAFLCVAVIGAGALAGWRVSIRFVRPDVDGRGLALPAIRLPEIDVSLGRSRDPGAAVPRAAGAGLPPHASSASVAVAAPLMRPPGSLSAPRAPQPFSGLHLTFQRAWHPVTYEIGAPTRKPPVRLMCAECPPANQTLNPPPAQPGDQATFGTTVMAGSGKVTLVEWDP